MSGLSLPRPSAAGAPRSSQIRHSSVSGRLANAMTLPACVGILVPVALVAAAALVGGLLDHDLDHVALVAPDMVLIALAAALVLGLWVHRRLCSAVLAGTNRRTALRAAALLTLRVLILCLVVWALGWSIDQLRPWHAPVTASDLLLEAVQVVVAGTGLLWTGILLGTASERWGWLRTALVAFVVWAFVDALIPDDGPWLVLRPWLEGDAFPLQGLALTILAVTLAVRELRLWEPAD